MGKNRGVAWRGGGWGGVGGQEEGEEEKKRKDKEKLLLYCLADVCGQRHLGRFLCEVLGSSGMLTQPLAFGFALNGTISSALTKGC